MAGIMVNNCEKKNLLVFGVVYLLVDCLQLLCIFRDSDRGDWVTYEDLIQQHNDLLPEDDSVVKVVMEKGDVKERKIIGFNGEVIMGYKVLFKIYFCLGNIEMESRTGLWKWTCRADDLGGNIPDTNKRTFYFSASLLSRKY